jgi:SAM-dependent methyltransferase
MGRFESTAATYAAHREPYPAEFFAAAAETLRLAGTEALIDLGTGPGLLAIGFAPYVGRILGVDPEPAMVAAAQKAAADAKLAFPVHLGRTEDLGAEFGAFDLVTIGRALHWMEREPTLAAFDRIIAPGGRILLCGAGSSKANPWREAFDRVTRAWSGGGDAAHRRIHENYFDGTRFARVTEIKARCRQPIAAEALFERALTRSSTSPAALGERVEAFRTELLEALAPYFGEGEREEIIEARAHVFAATN